jgi:hypothetical protein
MQPSKIKIHIKSCNANHVSGLDTYFILVIFNKDLKLLETNDADEVRASNSGTTVTHKDKY